MSGLVHFLRPALVGSHICMDSRSLAGDQQTGQGSVDGNALGSPEVPISVVADALRDSHGVEVLNAKRVGGVRLLPGRFMVIEQAIGVPKGRTAAQGWLTVQIEDMKSSGFVKDALARHRIEGALVAPAAK